MGSLLNNALKYISRPFTMGFASEAQQPGAIVPEAGRKIASIDQIGSIWHWESQLTWLVPDLLAEGSVNLISSASGTGKTWFAYFLAGAVAHGSAVFDKPVKQRKVVYVDGENPAFVVKQRLYDLGIPETPNLKVWGGWEAEPPPGPGQIIIEEYAKQEKPLLIWDSLVEFHTGEEQSSTATRQFMREFRHLANLGATVVILHHTGKSEGSQEYRGSSDIEAAVDMAFKLESLSKGKSTLDELTLRPFKCRLVPVPTRLLKYIQGTGFESEIIVNPVAHTESDPVEVVRKIVAAKPGLNQGMIVKLAKEKAKIGKHTVEDILKREDVFRIEKGMRNENLYYLVDQAVPQPVEEPEAEAEPVV